VAHHEASSGALLDAPLIANIGAPLISYFLVVSDPAEPATHVASDLAEAATHVVSDSSGLNKKGRKRPKKKDYVSCQTTRVLDKISMQERQYHVEGEPYRGKST
jgi:hypothetical protein